MEIINTAPRLISFIAPSGTIQLLPLTPVSIAPNDVDAARAALEGALRPFVRSKEIEVRDDAPVAARTQLTAATVQRLEVDAIDTAATEVEAPPTETPQPPAAPSGSRKRS